MIATAASTAIPIDNQYIGFSYRSAASRAPDKYVLRRGVKRGYQLSRFLDQPILITRLALCYLCLTGLIVGVWASFLPHAFYADFPGLGHSWVSVDGPFNGHLIRDVGAAYLSISALAALSLLRPERAPPVAVGVATLFFNGPHFAYHVSHLGMYAPMDRVLNVATLGTALLCSLLLSFRRAGGRT